jgi:hypothetical protein
VTERWEAGRETDAEVARRVFGVGEIVEWSAGYPVFYERVSDKALEPRPLPPYSTEMGAAWVLAEWMKEHGSSFLLNWGEDDGLWECSWITGGERYTGLSQYPALAICRAALAAMEEA